MKAAGLSSNLNRQFLLDTWVNRLIPKKGAYLHYNIWRTWKIIFSLSIFVTFGGHPMV